MKKRNKRYKGGAEFDHPLFRAPSSQMAKKDRKSYRLLKAVLMVIAGLILLIAIAATIKHYYGHVSGDLPHDRH